MKRDDEPKVDVDLLTDEQRKEYEKKPTILPWAIVLGSFLVVIIILVIVIKSLNP